MSIVMTAPVVDYKIHWLKMMPVPESRAIVGRHDGIPLARLLEHELTAKLETGVRLKFDSYPLDLAGRAEAFQKLVAGGVAVQEALIVSGLMAGG